MTSMLKVIASFAFFLPIAFVSLASEAAGPRTEWHKLETDHFEIVYDSKHYQLAKDFARHAETAWQTLVPVLRTWPDKTLVVIDDSGDQANGAATGFPYPQILLYPATPTPGETIGDTGPWGLELVTHEYTHILNFQPAHGVFHTLRNIFGTIVRPNLLLPRWYLEGLAVELETRFSPTGGRLRSPDFMAIPRAMVQDGTLRREDVSRIGETGIPDWPGGARPYLLGGLVWEKLARENLSIIGDLNDQYAKRIPFFIDGPLVDRTGKDWQGYLESVYSELEARSTAQIEDICEFGCNEGVKLGESGFYSRSPIFSRGPGGEPTALAYLSREHNRESIITITERDENGNYPIEKSKRVGEPSVATRIAWMPDASAIVYDAVDNVGHYEDRTDVWMYDRLKNRNVRLSRGFRAREPDANLAGTAIAFVQLTPGHTQIALSNIEDRNADKPHLAAPTILYVPEGENRVAWPTFVGPNTLVFVERNAEGKEVLKAMDIGTTARTVPFDGNVTFPRLVMDAKGKRSLLFASNRTGVTNLYQADLPIYTARDLSLTNVRPLTNSTTRAFNGDLDTKSGALIYSRLDGDGSHLRVSALIDREQNATLKSGKLKQVPLLIERPEPAHVVKEAQLPESALVAHDFNVWPHMIPRYWMPYAAFVPGGAFLSASTSSGDPMGQHSFAASISTDTRIAKPNFFAAYSNWTTEVRYTVMANDFWQRLSSSGLDRRSTAGDVSGLFFLPENSNKWKGEVGISQQRTETPSSTGTDVRTQGGPRVGVLWTDVIQRGYEIAPEKGGYTRLTHARFLPEMGNLVYDKTDLTLTGYYSKTSNPRFLGWLADRHVFVASFNVNWLPGLDRLLLAPSSVSLPVETVALGPTSTSFIMRGYPSGSFLARKLLRGSFEYHLPLATSFHGFGSIPAFVRRWHGVLFADMVTADGAFYDFDASGYRVSSIGNMYASIGAEARLDTTLFYHLPVQFIFGVHYGFDKRVNPNGAYPIISISL